MEEVVTVGWVVQCGPVLRLGAFVREHVITVLRLIIHTVKASNLQDGGHFQCYLMCLCSYGVLLEDSLQLF